MVCKAGISFLLSSSSSSSSFFFFFLTTLAMNSTLTLTTPQNSQFGGTNLVTVAASVSDGSVAH